jgi:hypothetical protein
VLENIRTLNNTVHNQTFLTYNVTFTDGGVDNCNFVDGTTVTDHGGLCVGIRERIVTNVAELCVRQTTVVGRVGVCVVNHGKSAFKVYGRCVAVMQYGSEQKLCENCFPAVFLGNQVFWDMNDWFPAF